MKREDFVCTIGFQGDTAIVDGTARRRYGKKTPDELLEAGLFRSAFCAALYDGTLEEFVPRFAQASGVAVESGETLKRLFGVFSVPEQAPRVKAVR
jgi:hypothetical protein